MSQEKSEGVATADLELATVGELAKIIGVDTATINRYVTRRILTAKSISNQTTPRGGRLYIIENAVKEIRANLNSQSHKGGKNRHASAKPKAEPKAKAKEETPKEPRKKLLEAGPGEDNLSRYNSAKAEDMELKVKLNRQKLDEQNRRLMDIERVKKTVYSYNSRVREAILNIPDQLGPELYASKSLFQMQERLRKGLNQALSNLDNLDNRIEKISEKK